jgi:SAM-dependent methyltransferase
MTNSYDAVAYPGFAFPNSHPDRLAVMATMHGLSPAPAAQARVLEVGCGEGSNLIPMAYALPGAHFTGFDLAHGPIHRGLDRIRSLALTNIRLFQADILTVGAGLNPSLDPSLGQFDYIIAHGVYAWVPEPVRNRLMSLCAELLAPNGIAFISYNALPGCHLRRIVRDAMLFRAESISDPVEQVTAGIEFLDFIREARGKVRNAADDFYSRLLGGQFDYLREREPHATIHDELSEAYDPVTFLDFVRHARAHGFDYLSESTLPDTSDPVYRQEIVAAVEQIAGPDFLRQEQMLDYVRARIYRETLLCHADLTPGRDPDPANLVHLHFASQAVSSPAEALGATRFTLSGGAHTDINHPAAIAVLLALEAVWPRALTLAELVQQTSGSAFAADNDGLRLLLRLAISRLIELRACDAPAVSTISSQPRASASARLETLIRPRASTLLHTTAQLDNPRLRTLLGLLDGTRDRAALLESFQSAFADVPSQELEQEIEAALRFFLRAGLLEA